MTESPTQTVAAEDPYPAPGHDGWRPGAVPWGWRGVFYGVLVAAAPVALITLIAYALPGGQTTSSAGLGVAVGAVVSTLLVDTWFLFAAWLFSLRRTGLGAPGWGLVPLRARLLWVIPVALLGVYAVSALYTSLIQTKEQTLSGEFPHTSAGLVLFFLLACVLAPLYEEAFFRGFVFQGLARSWGPVWGGVASAVLFGLSHQQLDIFVPLFALGAALAWVFYYSRSLWASVALHALFNAVFLVAWALG